MKLSVTIQTPEIQPMVPVALLSGTLEEKLQKAARWGADGVELMTIEPGQHDPADFQRLLRRAGLEVSAIASGAMLFAAGITLLHADPEVSALAKKRLYELIDFAAALGAPVVTVGSFRGRLSAVGARGRSLLAEILGKAAAYAGQRSVSLALEAVNRFEGDIVNNAEEGLTFVSEVNQPALGLLLDTFHVNIEESSYTEPFHRVFQADRLFHVHLGDNNRLAPGRGLIDFPAIVAVLRQDGYRGYLSAELLAKPDPDTAACQTLEYMRKLLSQ